MTLLLQTPYRMAQGQKRVLSYIADSKVEHRHNSLSFCTRFSESMYETNICYRTHITIFVPACVPGVCFMHINQRTLQCGKETPCGERYGGFIFRQCIRYRNTPTSVRVIGHIVMLTGKECHVRETTCRTEHIRKTYQYEMTLMLESNKA